MYIQKSQRVLAGAVLVLAVIITTCVVSLAGRGTMASDDERNIEKYAVKRVQPTYPPLAQQYKIEGVVTIQVSVGSNGRVTKAEFVRGHNIFRSVALDAAKRWEFKTNDSNLEGTIRFRFKLSQ